MTIPAVALALVLSLNIINTAKADVCFLPDSEGCGQVPYEEYGGNGVIDEDCTGDGCNTQCSASNYCYATEEEAIAARGASVSGGRIGSNIRITSKILDSYAKNGNCYCLKNSCGAVLKQPVGLSDSGYMLREPKEGTGWTCVQCEDGNSLLYGSYKCTAKQCASPATISCVTDECTICVDDGYSGDNICQRPENVAAQCPDGTSETKPSSGCYDKVEKTCSTSGAKECYKAVETPDCSDEGKYVSKADGVCTCACSTGYTMHNGSCVLNQCTNGTAETSCDTSNGYTFDPNGTSFENTSGDTIRCGSCVENESNCMDMCECFETYGSCEKSGNDCWVTNSSCGADEFEFDGECLACSRCASEIANTLAGNSGSSSTNVCWSASECEQNRIIMRNKYGCETACVTQHADFCTSGTRYVLDYGPGGPASCGFQTAADLNDSIMYDDETTTCIEQCTAQNEAIPDECMEAPDDEEYLYVEIDSDDSYTIDLKGTNITVSNGVYKIGPNSIFKFTGEYDGDIDYSLGEFDEHACTSEEGYLHTDGDFRSLAVSGLPSGAVVYITRTVDTSEASLTCMTGGWYDDEDGGYCDDNTDSCEYIESYSSDDYTLASFVKEIEDLGGIVNYNNEEDPILVRPSVLSQSSTVYVKLQVKAKNDRNYCTYDGCYCEREFNAEFSVSADRGGRFNGYTYEVNDILLRDGSYTCSNLHDNNASNCGYGGWQDTYGTGLFSGSFNSTGYTENYLNGNSHSNLEPGGPVIARASYKLKKGSETVYSGTYKAAVPVYVSSGNACGTAYYNCDVVKYREGIERQCSPNTNCYTVPGTNNKICFVFR